MTSESGLKWSRVPFRHPIASNIFPDWGSKQRKARFGAGVIENIVYWEADGELILGMFHVSHVSIGDIQSLPLGIFSLFPALPLVTWVLRTFLSNIQLSDLTRAFFSLNASASAIPLSLKPRSFGLSNLSIWEINPNRLILGGATDGLDYSKKCISKLTCLFFILKIFMKVELMYNAVKFLLHNKVIQLYTHSFSLFFLMAAPSAYGSSCTRDWIWTAHGTHTAALAMLDPLNPLHRAADWTRASTATQATAVGFLIHCATAELTHTHTHTHTHSFSTSFPI